MSLKKTNCVPNSIGGARVKKILQISITILFITGFSISYAQNEEVMLSELRNASDLLYSNPAEAIRLYEEIIQKYPKTKFAVESQVMIGKAYVRLGDYIKAQKSWQEAIDLYSNDRCATYGARGDELARYCLQTIFDGAQPDTLRKFIQNNSESNLVDKAQYEIGNYFHRHKKLKDAVREYQKLIEKYPASEYTEKTKAYIAEYSEIQKEEIQLKKIIYTAGKSEKVAEYIFRVGKLYYDFLHKYPICLEVGLALSPAFDKFQQLIKEQPASQWTDNAEYYILMNEAINSFEGGDVSRVPLYAQKFEDFIKRYPNSEFAPGLQYKIGEYLYSYVYPVGGIFDFNGFLSNIGIWSDTGFWKIYGTDPRQYFELAIKAYETVLKYYPESEYVSLAKKQIQAVKEKIREMEDEIAKLTPTELKGKIEYDEKLKSWIISDVLVYKKYIIAGEKINTIQQFNGKMVKVSGIIGPVTGREGPTGQIIEWRPIYVISIETK